MIEAQEKYLVFYAYVYFVTKINTIDNTPTE